MLRASDIQERKLSTCREPGCVGTPNGRKPFCEAHLARMPYVRSVVAELEQRAREAELVAQRGPPAVDLAGSRAREVLELLRAAETPLTLAQLREVDVEKEVLAAYLQALERAGKIETLVERANGRLSCRFTCAA